ncbi:hypothetical protein EOL94_01870 [bacterium]|nr:hypothetical protein [bacterium]
MKIKKDKHIARFAFLYALSLVALILTALSVGIISFQIINKSIIDTVNQYNGRYTAEALRFALSALLVSTPIFYFTTKDIHKNLFLGNLKGNSDIRKWFTYAILFVSSFVIAICLISTFNGFLNGELTNKFLLKILVAFIISVITFSFYLYDVRREKTEGEKDRIIKLYFWISLVLVIVSFTAGIFFIESPKEVRRQKIDSTLLNNISFISAEIHNYYHNTNSLPGDLKELIDYNNLSGINFYDPETKQIIDYKIINDKEYELCANFRTENIGYDQFQNREFYNEMKHEAGPYCFKKEIYLNVNLK